ncbi:MAG: hypothetical protein ISR68_02355 [Campylobacterales bacterium]|nr:hypothetical protein [Campylobacterales bacterium]
MKLILLALLLTLKFAQANFFSTEDKSERLYLYHTDHPKNVYTNQVFSIKLKAIIVANDFNEVNTNFTDQKNITLLNPDSKWKQVNKNEFYNIYKFKVANKDFLLPKITLLLLDSNQNIKYQKTLDPVNINFNKIAIDDKLFSNLIAKNVYIKGQTTKQYNNNLLLSVLEIEATDSNLEDFKLKQYTQQGIEDFSVNNNIKTIFYYVITPRDDKFIKFKYYNSIQKTFINIDSPIILTDELISTQTDLNPQNSKLLFYQKVILAVLLILFIGLYFKTKHKINILFMLITIALFMMLMIPNKTMNIASGTNIYILPLKNSTIFHTTKQSQTVELIGKKNGFNKIILSNDTIGWIKSPKGLK